MSPFAPAVLADHVATWCQLTTTRPDVLTDHMLSVVPVTEAGRETLGAVPQVDGPARVQIVSATSSPRLHGVLEAHHAQTGAVLLNTSMNLKGEPLCVATLGPVLRANLKPSSRRPGLAARPPFVSSSRPRRFASLSSVSRRRVEGHRRSLTYSSALSINSGICRALGACRTLFVRTIKVV